MEVCDDSLAKFKVDRLAGIVPPPKPGDSPRPVMAGTVNRDLSTVISVLNRAARLWMWIPHVPLIRRVEGPKKKPYPLSWKEQDRLFAKLPEHLRQASLFKVNTGLRERELCSLTWDMEVAIDELDTTAFITFGHRLRSAGVSLEDRKDLLGHKSNEVTTLYSLADISRLIEFVERITVRKQTFMLRPVRQSNAEVAEPRV